MKVLLASFIILTYCFTFATSTTTESKKQVVHKEIKNGVLVTPPTQATAISKDATKKK